MNLQEQLKEVTTKIATLETESRSEKVTAERLAAINDEVDTLIEKRNALEAKIREENKQAFQRAQVKVNEQERAPGVHSALMTDEEAEQRLRTLRQNRSITLSTLDTLTIDHKANNIKGTFNQVSSILDLVTYKYFPGGESFSQAFMKTYGEAGYTAEGDNAHESEPTWGYALINKAKITAYTEVSEEFEKLKPSYYLAEITRNLTISMRKKLAREIILGSGDSNRITGILAPHAKVAALETSKDLEILTIDENTLNEIVLSFGGDEDIYRGVLVLNKSILKDFLKVRGADKKPVYKVDFVNSTIDGVPYVISSHIKDHATATAGDYTLLYGTLGHYDLVSFAPIEISKSTDFKFRQGQIAYRAVGIFGGNVTSFNAILRVKKKAAPAG